MVVFSYKGWSLRLTSSFAEPSCEGHTSESRRRGSPNSQCRSAIEKQPNVQTTNPKPHILRSTICLLEIHDCKDYSENRCPFSTMETLPPWRVVSDFVVPCPEKQPVAVLDQNSPSPIGFGAPPFVPIVWRPPARVYLFVLIVTGGN